MKVKVLGRNNELKYRILKAEKMMDELGLRVTHNGSTIVIEDTKSGMQVYDKDKDQQFPRCTESSFVVME